MSGPLWTPDQGTVPRVPQSRVRATVVDHHTALVTLTNAVSSFFRMGFRQRVGWLLFGARVFGPPPPKQEPQ